MIILVIGGVSLVIFIACVGNFLPYRMSEMLMTMMRGPQAVNLLMGEMMSMERRMLTRRK